MNPLTNIKNVQKLNDRELELGIIGKKSWHDEYKDSAWIYVGGLPFDLTEGDVICVFSQYGELVNINLVRDQKTGKSKGFAFLCFEDQRSTVLSVDNLNGIKILGRTIRVDHVKDYKMPKEKGDEDDLTKQIRAEGCAPKMESSSEEQELEELSDSEVKRAEKKAKKKKKKEKIKKKMKRGRSSSDEEGGSRELDDSKSEIKTEIKIEIKQEKEDSGYERALNRSTAALKEERWSRGDRFEREDKKKKARRSRSKSDSNSPRRRSEGGIGVDRGMGRNGTGGKVEERERSREKGVRNGRGEESRERDKRRGMDDERDSGRRREEIRERYREEDRNRRRGGSRERERHRYDRSRDRSSDRKDKNDRDRRR